MHALRNITIRAIGTIAVALAAGAACAPKLLPPPVVVPHGPSTPEPKALDYWWAASNACRMAQSFSAELVITGRVGNEKLRRATIHSAMTRQDQIRLEAVAPIGGPIFVLAGTTQAATLTLPRDKRVVTAQAADIVEALIGIRLTPWDWLDVLSGCVRRDSPGGGVRIGDAIVLDPGPIVMRQHGAGWRIAGGERNNATVDYQAFAGSWPSKLRVFAAPRSSTGDGAAAGGSGARVALDLTISVEQIFANTNLNPAAFEPPASTGFRPMTIAELRAIGPLGDSGGGA